MNFSGKKIYIAPHTPKTTMFQKELTEQFNFKFLGFIDNYKIEKEILKPSEIKKNYDFILILSQNHGDAIYDDFKKKFPKNKIIKIDIKDGNFIFLDENQIKKNLTNQRVKKYKKFFLKSSINFLDFIGFKRSKIIFISKSFISTNNKALYSHCFTEGMDIYMLTDNVEQYQELKALSMPVVKLESFHAFWLIAQAKLTIQDQANLSYEINLLSPKQKSLQMWHGIPLKRLNKLTTVAYDYLVSTSDFVNETTLAKVIEAKYYKDFGYPRNDIFMKEKHDIYDLLFCDKNIYDFAKKNFGTYHKIALYMPTHRESKKAAKIPLDFEKLNESLKQLNATFILKLHPFVMELYKDEKQKQKYSNILFHSAQGDVYPLLKYTDILITDYSSVYFDFLLLNRPIIFFDYDKEEYEKNMQGFLYDYESFTPGIHIKTQNELVKVIKTLSIRCDDGFKNERDSLKYKLFNYTDENSSQRINNEIFVELN